MLRIAATLILLHAALFSAGQTWTMVWSDEFDYTGLPDTSKWVYDVGGDGWGNNELQYYTEDRLENARVEDGVLTIEARAETFGGRNYTSARLLTREKGDWLYGRVEVRAKLPEGTGVWPAVWMLPTDWEYGGWPASGEIDIMEYVGYDPNKVHFTVHTEAYNHMIGTQRGSSTLLDDPENNFYTYAIEWFPDRIDFFVNDDKHYTFSKGDDDTYAQWPFDKRFHLILNIAVGGDWGGAQGVDSDIFPQTLDIEYVRVYKSAETMQIDGPEKVYANQPEVTFSVDDIEGWQYEWILPEDAEVVSGAESHAITVRWGCTADTVACRIINDEFDETIVHPVGIQEPTLSGSMFFEPNQQGIEYHVPELHSTSYTWSIPPDASIEEGAGTHAITVQWGVSSDSVSVNIDNSCYDTTLAMLILQAGQYPYPDVNTPHPIPGTINATHYDYGGQGVAYHDTSPTNQGPGTRQDESVDTEFGDNGGPNVGWITSGEWLEYTINVEEDGRYQAAVRVASNVNGTRGPIQLIVNGENRAEISPNFTGAWNSFSTRTEDIILYTTDTLLRVDMGAGNFNLGDMTFSFITSATGLVPEPTDVRVYPNPFTDYITIEASSPIQRVLISTLTGQMVGSYKFNALDRKHNLNLQHIPAGAYIITTIRDDSTQSSKRIIK